MASEPAEPTTRQDPVEQAVELASEAVHAQWMETKRAQGVASRCSESGEELMVPYAELSEAAKDLDRGSVRATVTALAEAGLLADPAQTTELAGVVDVPVGSKAYRLINELTADLEQARTQRNEAMETAGQLRGEVHEHQVAAANLYGRVFVALGLSITAPWAGLADAAGRVRAERDALSLLLRGMARKLVATRGERDALERILSKERRKVDAALALHTEFKIYTDCGHQHTDEDVDAGRAIEVNDVGYTCEDGLMYLVCRACCNDGSEWQSNTCADHHEHPCWPCPTRAALVGDQPPTGRPSLEDVAAWFNRKLEQVEANPNFESDADADRNHYAYTLAHSVVQLAIEYPERWMQSLARIHGERLDEPDVTPPLSGVALRVVEEANEAAGDLP